LETARLVAEPLGLKVRVVEMLAGPLDADSLEHLLHAAGEPGRPVLVGHDPDFSELAAELAGVAELPLRKGALLRIDLERPVGPASGLIRWLVPPELLETGQVLD
jgi:phosphohistidine phosphatase SixA